MVKAAWWRKYGPKLGNYHIRFSLNLKLWAIQLFSLFVVIFRAIDMKYRRCEITKWLNYRNRFEHRSHEHIVIWSIKPPIPEPLLIPVIWERQDWNINWFLLTIFHQMTKAPRNAFAKLFVSFFHRKFALRIRCLMKV